MYKKDSIVQGLRTARRAKIRGKIDVYTSSEWFHCGNYLVTSCVHGRKTPGSPYYINYYVSTTSNEKLGWSQKQSHQNSNFFSIKIMLVSASGGTCQPVFQNG